MAAISEGVGSLTARLDALTAGQQRAVRAWQDSGLSLRESLAKVEDAHTEAVYEAVFGGGPPAGAADVRVRESDPTDDPYEALFGGGVR